MGPRGARSDPGHALGRRQTLQRRAPASLGCALLPTRSHSFQTCSWDFPPVGAPGLPQSPPRASHVPLGPPARARPREQLSRVVSSARRQVHSAGLCRAPPTAWECGGLRPGGLAHSQPRPPLAHSLDLDSTGHDSLRCGWKSLDATGAASAGRVTVLPRLGREGGREAAVLLRGPLPALGSGSRDHDIPINPVEPLSQRLAPA